MVSSQKVVISGLVIVAFGALGLATAYRDDQPLGDTSIVEGNQDTTPTTAASSDESGRAGQVGEVGEVAGKPSSNANPIEAFLPLSPTGANCREPVGVDLISGYAATLIINGERIPVEEMNEADPETGAIPAARTHGRYTYGPEENCPNGARLRPRDNTLQVCVYRLEEGPDNCVVSEFTFNAL